MRTDKINFQARPIAIANVKAKNITQRYKLYEINGIDDKFFLQDLYDSIDIDKLYPKLNKKELFFYDVVLRGGLKSSIYQNSGLTLLAKDDEKIPCGFLYYVKNPMEYYVKYAATWGSKVGERALMAGKTLFIKFFNDIMRNEKVNKVEIDALRLSAFDPVGKYMELGFSSCGGTNSDEYMAISRKSIQKTLEKFKDKIQITNLENQPEVSLYNELSMPQIII